MRENYGSLNEMGDVVPNTKMETAESYKPLETSSETFYACHICQNNFSSTSNMNQHIRRVHKIEDTNFTSRSSEVKPVVKK